MIKHTKLKPSYIQAKRRTKEEVKILTDEYIMTNELKKLGLGKKYHIITYGCQGNVRDSETISAILEDMSFVNTENMEDADLILLNTCAIRENAHNKVFGMLGRIKHLKETKPEIITILCGCMAQEESVVNEIEKDYKWMDVVFGTHNIQNLPKLLSEAMDSNELIIEVFSKEGDIIENLPVKRDNKYKAFVNIMYGCDKFCTYCIVPFTRGKQRSRKEEDILKEVNDLIKNGYKEVTLLGQNVNAYGKDLSDGSSMDKLLEDVAKTGIERVRFVTSHPWDFTDEMIDIIAKYPNIMPYIHLPLQSGSNEILKLMGRRYTKESYLALAKKIREKIPNASITTDIIVGFPNETEEDFNETLKVVDEVKYDGAFTFIYSPRENTPAAKMKDSIDLKTKQERLYKLNELVNKYSNESNNKLLDKVVPVLIEGPSTKGDNIYSGYTDTMKLVNVKCDKEDLGKIINVKITDAKSWSLNGEKVNE
ncbi:MAG: tRNA (N6-isopentenyl adenosine(37)-C2)-methylthiotransferase MiaB [Bacilli bacterium]|nr:tRNA (N6-isopentenyl adenosine(37)-C2)-methylthiotransferase MiaB [Bacilli bacterium]MBO6195749.1 tRNA (N6-isopentenyl adenosine(37)-C2)-methylthiotransferase MiaB [Bacilli bacterium]